MTMKAGPWCKYIARRVLRGRYGILRGQEFEVPDWDLYAMDVERPFAPLESLGQETRIVDRALAALAQHGILADTRYDADKYLAMRNTVRERFEIPWSAITPRMQRLIYAINAIHQPRTMIAAGVFCGFTFISNAGAAAGPGAVYQARSLIGLEVDTQEAERAERNVRRLDPTGVARIVCADAVAFCAAWDGPIDLLYLDADDFGGSGKAINLDIAQAAWARLPSGALLVAHNSVNGGEEMRGYLNFVRDRAHCRASVNLVVDGEGLEVSRR